MLIAPLTMIINTGIMTRTPAKFDLFAKFSGLEINLMFYNRIHL